MPGTSFYNRIGGPWRQGLQLVPLASPGQQGHGGRRARMAASVGVCPAPSSAPSAPPRQSGQAQVGTRRAGKAPADRIGSRRRPAPIRGQPEGPRPVSRTPRCSEVSSQLVVKATGC